MSTVRFPLGLSANIGLLLAEGGEFAFVLFTMAMAVGVLAPVTGKLLLAVVALSMMLTPGLAVLGRWAERRATGERTDFGAIESETSDLRDHVVIAGFGRVGQTVAGLLGESQIPYVALDLNVASVMQARAQGMHAFYGDGARADVLKACGTARARAAVVTLDHADAAERTVAAVRRLQPDIHVIARARDNVHRERLLALGAADVVMELGETSLQLAGMALSRANIRPEEIDEALASLRDDAK